MTVSTIGTSALRKEGRDKLDGRAVYIDDMHFPDMIYGITIRSSIPRGSIVDIHFGEGIPWDEFVIVSAKDIPGKNAVLLLTDDQPFLADGAVNHKEEPILLIAHRDRHILEDARRSIAITYKPQVPLFDIEASLNCKQMIWGKDNIFKDLSIARGDVESAFAKADLIVEGIYHTGAQEQLYIEPNGMIATYSDNDGVTVWGSMQCPYYIHKALTALFALPDNKIRIIQAETGGGFGGKEEYPSILAGHAALLAMKAKKPVKMIYDRAEDMAATTKRHPSRTSHRTAVSKDGTILGIDIDFAIDGGAYMTLSPVVLSRGAIHAVGPYRCENVRIRARAVATNAPPHGAFRGFGAPQSIFAMERHLDVVAKRLGLSPQVLREKNLIRDGERLATGQVVRDGVDMREMLADGLRRSNFVEKQEIFAKENPGKSVKKGIGLATFMHGSGFTGSGERYLSSVAGVEATAEGRLRVLVSSTEIGQGTLTILSQIAAEAIGLPLDCVETLRPDTHLVPNSGPTVASRTTMVVGKLVETASLGLKAMLIQHGLPKEGWTKADFARTCASYIAKHGELKSYTQYRQPPTITWDEQLYRGDAYGCYAWGLYIAEVSVDTIDYQATVDAFWAVQEIGKIINPTLAEGQIQGGVAQGIGYALYEKCVFKDGAMVNNQMTNYIMPTAVDVPPIYVSFQEQPYHGGPGGAKGIGELPMDGPAPAILNAIDNALGVSYSHIPLLPEDIMKGLVNHD